MRIAVIGGGIAGLAAAHELLRRGADPVVFEADARPGGKVGSFSERGYLTEDGPNFLGRPLDALLEASGLRAEVVEPRPPTTRWIHLDGRVLRAPSLALLARIGVGRALLEPLFARPLREDVPLSVFLERRLGKRAGGIAASVLSAGVYAGDPARLSARDAFPSLGAMAEKGSLLLHAIRRPKGPRAGIWTLRGGLGTLPEALAKSLGLRIRLGTRARQLAPSEDGWSVQGERFDGVVLAVPAAAAAELTRGFAPRFADLAGQFQSAPVAVVHVGLRQETLPRGFGLIDSEGTLHSVGMLLPGSMLPGRAPEGRALVTAICGGARHPERAALDDRELVAGVVRDLRSTWGVSDAPDYVRIVRWPEAIPQYAPGHRDRVREARDLLVRCRRLELAGAAWDGVGVPDVARSGAAAAARLIP
ncbi:MAG: protoporphyrinogen oxidase [Deltaproteobacteria bacterium]|nr:MAG: protoporphyrinogen oxidase [Deltaproteobacteria bacterium]